jgi:GAF domain-containing protein/DNA-binding CsgD family transcriptional regulator
MVVKRPVTIGEAARRVGTPEWRLRAWESAGLLKPERSPSGYRLYSETDLEQAARIATELDGAERLARVGLEHVGPSAIWHDASGAVGIESEPAATKSAGREQSAAIAASARIPNRLSSFDERSLAPPTSRTTSRATDSTVRLGGERELRILRRLANAVRHTDDRRALIDTALESALEATGAYIGALSSADFTRQQYVLLSSVGLSEQYVRGIDSWRLHEGLAGRAFGLREPLLVADLQGDRHVARDVVHDEGLRAYVCVPLLRGQRRLGILEVFARTPGRFDADDVALLELVAAAVAPLIEIADLERHVDALQEERARSFREWAAQVAATSDEERGELADELARLAASLRQGATSVQDAATAVERAADGLRGGAGAQLDLMPLVQSNIVRRLGRLHAIDLGVHVDEWPATLPSGLTSRLYLIVLALAEGAAAVARTTVRLHFVGGDDALVVELGDDRETPPSGIRVVPVTPEVLNAVRNLGGTIALTEPRDGETVALRVILPRRELDALGDTLTARERGVLEALRLGATNREIAAELGIAVKTLQNHLTALYRKLGVASRAEAIRYADQSSTPERVEG